MENLFGSLRPRVRYTICVVFFLSVRSVLLHLATVNDVLLVEREDCGVSNNGSADIQHLLGAAATTDFPLPALILRNSS